MIRSNRPRGPPAASFHGGATPTNNAAPVATPQTSMINTSGSGVAKPANIASQSFAPRPNVPLAAPMQTNPAPSPRA